MVTVPLLGGGYAGRSPVAAFRQCINLYPESYSQDQQPPVPVTHYPTPGLTLETTSPTVESIRWAYRASNGNLYTVVGPNVYFVDPTLTWQLLGSIPDASSPVGFADNGQVIVLVDGTSVGYAIEMTTQRFAQITDPNFYGGTSAVYLDTYFIFNRPNTPQFYISLSNATFDMLTGTVGEIYEISIASPGTGYADGAYTNVPLTGGTGSGATANLVISDGQIIDATVNVGGNDYTIGDVLSSNDPSIGAAGVATGTITNAGASYTNGTYGPVPMTGGTGTGAQATIVVTANKISSVTISISGSGYVVGDVLSATAASIGGTGTGFAWTVSTIATGLALDADAVHGNAFDPLDIAAKTGSADNIACIATVHGELWLIGFLATEIWADTGAADFPFERIQGAFVDHGTVAPYSLSQQDISLFWVEQDRQGNGIIVQSDGYSVKQISTRYIEEQIQGYANLADAFSFCHQISGHAFAVFVFPAADVTWVYDLATSQWHKWCSIDGNGVLHRNRANCYAFAYGTDFVGDYQNGNLYSLSSNVFTDNGVAIPRIITFIHLIKNGQRVVYNQFQAKMEVGQSSGTTASDPPKASLRWSDTGGLSWGQPVRQSIGATGQYLTAPQWQRLGLARDRVFELSWDVNAKVVLNGAYINYTPAQT